MLNSNFVILGSLINLSSAFVYLSATVKEKVKPNRVIFSLGISIFYRLCSSSKTGSWNTNIVYTL